MKTIVSALLLASCAPAASLSPAPGKMATLMVMGDSEAGLQAFEAAARACGLRTLERVPKPSGGYWIRVFGPTDWTFGNRTNPYWCAEKYLAGHPRAGRYFVGNAPQEH